MLSCRCHNFRRTLLGMVESARDQEHEPEDAPDYRGEAATLAPLYELFRAIARRVAAHENDRAGSGGEADPRL